MKRERVVGGNDLKTRNNSQLFQFIVIVLFSRCYRFVFELKLLQLISIFYGFTDLYKIYSELIKFDSNLIEFEVVSLSEADDELSKVINNPLGYYNNNWDELDSVENYLDIKDKNITSPEDLVKEVK